MWRSRALSCSRAWDRIRANGFSSIRSICRSCWCWCPTPRQPHLRAYRRYEKPAHDAGIAGTFFNLLDMIDGSLDGDALFFSRDLRVSGDTEAVVALRNALDDFEGSALDSVVSSFGALSAPAALALSAVRAVRGTQHHDSRGMQRHD